MADRGKCSNALQVGCTSGANEFSALAKIEKCIEVKINEEQARFAAGRAPVDHIYTI